MVNDNMKTHHWITFILGLALTATLLFTPGLTSKALAQDMDADIAAALEDLYDYMAIGDLSDVRKYVPNNITALFPKPPLPSCAKRFLVGCSSRPSCDSPNTSRRFALGASDVCLVGENPTRSVPAL